MAAKMTLESRHVPPWRVVLHDAGQRIRPDFAAARASCSTLSLDHGSPAEGRSDVSGESAYVVGRKFTCLRIGGVAFYNLTSWFQIRALRRSRRKTPRGDFLADRMGQ